MDVNMNETEQLQVIRDWWQAYGRMIITVLIVAVASNFGWSYYQGQQAKKSEYASRMYHKMIDSYYKSNAKDVKANADYLTANFPQSPYADIANFTLAKQAVKDGKYEEAITLLDAVIKQNRAGGFKQIARIRKARVLLAQDKTDVALSTLEKVDEPSFMPLINEVRGDIYVAKGQPHKARTEYQAALKAMPMQETNRTILQMKYDQLAGPQNGIA